MLKYFCCYKRRAGKKIPRKQRKSDSLKRAVSYGFLLFSFWLLKILHSERDKGKDIEKIPIYFVRMGFNSTFHYINQA